MRQLFVWHFDLSEHGGVGGVPVQKGRSGQQPSQAKAATDVAVHCEGTQDAPALQRQWLC